MKETTTINPETQNPKSRTQNEGHGTLYIVSTPIGNLEDITLRALRILKSVDLIAAEGVRHSRGICKHYNIKTKITAYNQHNRGKKGTEILRKLRSGFDVALITNAGTPGISDPGTILINQALEADIRVSPVPGPSAVIAALSVSGLRTDGFLFTGFLSNRPGKRRKQIRSLFSEPRTMVFYEAPHRLLDMLKDLKEILGDRQIVIIREMTKVYEEMKRGPVSLILEQLETGRVRGEYTLVVSGKERGKDIQTLKTGTRKRIEKLIMNEKMSIKEIAAKLSHEEGLAYRKMYKECISIKRSIGLA